MEMAKEKNDYKAKMVRELREARGWSQGQLAEIASLSERTIQRIEKDGIGSHETWMALAQAFDRQVADFDKLEQTPEQKDLLKKLRILVGLKTGKEVLDLCGGAHAFLHEAPQPKNPEEAALFGEFLDHAKDCGEIWSEMTHTHKMEAYLETDRLLKTLDDNGFWVFGEVKPFYFKSMAAPKEPIEMTTAVVMITNKDNPTIVDDGKGNRMLPVVYGNHPVI